MINKTYEHAGKIYTLWPLSAWDVLEMPDLVAGAILRRGNSDGDKSLMPDHETILLAVRDVARQILARQLGLDPVAFRAFPAGLLVTMLADFLEMNLSENFLSDLSRLIGAAGQVRSWWSKLSERSATAGKKSGATPSAESGKYSTPAPPSIPRRVPGDAPVHAPAEGQ